MNQPDLTTPAGLRDRAVLEILYSTGMRRKELTGLRLYDLDLERGTVMIRGASVLTVTLAAPAVVPATAKVPLRVALVS